MAKGRPYRDKRLEATLGADAFDLESGLGEVEQESMFTVYST